MLDFNRSIPWGKRTCLASNPYEKSLNAGSSTRGSSAENIIAALGWMIKGKGCAHIKDAALLPQQDVMGSPQGHIKERHTKIVNTQRTLTMKIRGLETFEWVLEEERP